MIRDVKKTISGKLSDVDDASETIGNALKSVNDLVSYENPSCQTIETTHINIDTMLSELVSGLEVLENSTVSTLKESVEPLIAQISQSINGMNQTPLEVSTYQKNSFFNDEASCIMVGMSQLCYEYHENGAETYATCWEIENALEENAEQRETAGIWATIGGVALIVTGAICVFVTAGASSTLIVAGGAILGGGTVAFGVLDGIEGAQDIIYGANGDITTESVNLLKTAMGEEAYYFTENVFAFGASAMIPIGQAQAAARLTFRSGSAIVAKEAASELAGFATEKIATELGANPQLSMIAGMVASGTTAKGLEFADARFHISAGGNAPSIDSGKYSILSYEDAENIAFDAIHGPNNADAVVLGKYGNGGPTAYTSVAKDIDAQYFQLDNWDELATHYSDDEIWKVNEKFLDIQTSSGREIYLSHNPEDYLGKGQFYSRELQYLLDNGYKFVDEGEIWHAVR